MDVIKVKNFAKKFGNKVVHKDITLNVHQGECLGLIGGSGAGKSVILRTLIGLEKPDHGEIYIEGEEISGKSEKELIPIRIKVAYVFQNGALFDSMSVYDNLAYPLREHTPYSEQDISKKIMSTLNEFGLSGNELLPPAELSGGMQKRVGMARSIILDPHIILYDEPTAGLDPFNTIKVQEMILKMKERGASSILVTHDMPTAFAVCDRIALIEGGKIADVETVSEIKNNPNNPIYQFMQGHSI